MKKKYIWHFKVTCESELKLPCMIILLAIHWSSRSKIDGAKTRCLAMPDTHVRQGKRVWFIITDYSSHT